MIAITLQRFNRWLSRDIHEAFPGAGPTDPLIYVITGHRCWYVGLTNRGTRGARNRARNHMSSGVAQPGDVVTVMTPSDAADVLSRPDLCGLPLRLEEELIKALVPAFNEDWSPLAALPHHAERKGYKRPYSLREPWEYWQPWVPTYPPLWTDQAKAA